MRQERTPPVRAVRALLLLLATVLVGYAISDHPFYGGEPGFGRMQLAIAMLGALLAAAATLPDRLAEGMLLVAISSLITLAVAETAADALLGARHRPIYQADDRLVFKFIPDRRSAMRRLPANGGAEIAHRINRDGFRGDELLPSGEAKRIVVYGDSFIHASYSPDEETFAAALGVRLAQNTGSRFEVVNAGVSSYGPDQISVKMEDELPRLRPDLVVVSIFAGNDYGDLLRNKLFQLADDGTLTTSVWRLDPKVRGKLELSQRESLLLRALRASFGGSRGGAPSTTMDWDFLLKEAEREYHSHVVDRDPLVTNTHVDYYSADVSLTPHSNSARFKVALMQAVLARIRDVAARHGVPLAFLFIPHPHDVARGTNWAPIDRNRFPDYDERNLIAPLEDGARALGVPFVSLWNSFRTVDADSLYFRGGDDHWNADGQRLAADLMAAQLLVQLRVTR